MELTEQGVRRADAGRVPFSLYRAGDVLLCLIWVVFGLSKFSGAITELRADNQLAALHFGMIAAVFFINGSLFVLRGPAVRRSTELWPMLIAFVGTWATVPLAMQPLTVRSDWLLAATSVGMIVAYGFAIWGLLTLRRSFSIFPEARELIRSGPYALVRHPLYAVYILTYVLIALPRFGPMALMLAVVGIAGEVLRARNEERILAASFPDYREYAAVTPRFVPKLV